VNIIKNGEMFQNSRDIPVLVTLEPVLKPPAEDPSKRPPVIKHQNGRMYVHRRGRDSWRSITPTAFQTVSKGRNRPQDSSRIE